MRLPASEKLEIIGLVEQSHLPARRTLQMLGINPSTFISLVCFDRDVADRTLNTSPVGAQRRA